MGLNPTSHGHELDDSHAAPVAIALYGTAYLYDVPSMSSPGKVLRCCCVELKPRHAPPLCAGPRQSPRSLNLAAVLPRRCAYRVSYDTEQPSCPTSSTHRLRRGLPGYLILFAPHASRAQRQYRTRSPPSPPVFFPISTNFTPYIRISTTLFRTRHTCIKRSPQVEPGNFTPDQCIFTAYAPFTPSHS